jgi:hypothetical protein
VNPRRHANSDGFHARCPRCGFVLIDGGCPSAQCNGLVRAGRRRRNADESWRDLWRQAGTGDLDAAKALVRALERAGRDEDLRGPLTSEEIGDAKKISGLVNVSLDEIPNLDDMLVERLVGDRVSGRLAAWELVDISEDGMAVVRVTVDGIELPQTNACVRCGTQSPCTCDNLAAFDRDLACPQHGATTDYDNDLAPEDQGMSSEKLCGVCLSEISQCDDWCATGHDDEECDGYCTHREPSHMNACLDGNDRELTRIMRERRESH